MVLEDGICRQSREPQFLRSGNCLVLVVFVLHWKHTRGYDTDGRVVVEIAAFDEVRYDYVGEQRDLILHSDTLRLKFEGFRELITSPVTPK